MKQLLLIILMLHVLLPINAEGMKEYGGTSGSFTDGRADAGYPNYYETGYLITVPEGLTVTISFTNFNVNFDNGFVEIYDGDNYDGTLIGRYTNANPPPAKITATGNILYIWYYYESPSYNTSDAWAVSYSSDAINTIKPKLLAYYPFNENAADVSGGAKNCSVSNATLTTDKSGNANNAYNFNGSNSLIYLPNNLMTGNSAFAISCWIKPSGIHSTSDQGQVVLDLRGQMQVFIGYYQSNYTPAPNTVMFYTYSSPNAKVIWSANNSILPGNWYHLVASYRNNTMEFYINGALTGSCAANPPGLCSGYYNVIGKDYNTYLNRCWFYGSIDEVIFFKQSLTAPEVQALYNSGLSATDIPELYGPVTFSYDAFGNRTGKNVITLKAGSFAATARDSASADARNGKITDPEIFQGSAGEAVVKIYPNPTRGELKVDITDFDFAQQSAIYLCNTAGHLVAQQSPASGSNIINLLQQPDGLYLMKIQLGDKVSEWKIIKE